MPSYSDAWITAKYHEVRPEEFTYDPLRGEVARGMEADPRLSEKAGTIDVATDAVAETAVDDFHGPNHSGFPDDFWDPISASGIDDEVHLARADNSRKMSNLVDFSGELQARAVNDGSEAHRFRTFHPLDDVSLEYRTATEYDPEAYLLPDPTGPDATRLISGGPGAFNSYASKNSFARKPMETFVRENRVMQGGNLDNPHDIRPLYYNRGQATLNTPSSGGSDRWGLVYSAWDSFTPEYLAQAPYNAADVSSPALTDTPTTVTIDQDWAW